MLTLDHEELDKTGRDLLAPNPRDAHSMTKEDAESGTGTGTGTGTGP